MPVEDQVASWFFRLEGTLQVKWYQFLLWINHSSTQPSPDSPENSFLYEVNTLYEAEKDYSNLVQSPPMGSDDFIPLPKSLTYNYSDFKKIGWRVYNRVWLAIDYRDPHNLYTAIQRLAPILFKEQIEFVCLLVSRNGQAVDHDATYFTPAQLHIADLDDDPRGKEFVLFLKYNDELKQYDKTPEEYKRILLTCLQALFMDPPVKLGYVHTPFGAQQLADFPLPIAKIGFQDWKKRHGRLRVPKPADTNHFSFPDPLQGVKITWADLKQYHLTADHLLEMQRQKIAYLEEHYLASSAAWKERYIELAQATTTTSSILYTLKNLTDIFEGKTVLQLSPKIRQNIEESTTRIHNNGPYRADDGKNAEPFKPAKSLFELWEACKNAEVLTEDTVNNFKTYLARCKDLFITEFTKLQNDLNNNDFSLRKIAQIKGSGYKQNLNDVIGSHPRAILLLIHNAILLDYEAKSLPAERKQLDFLERECNAKKCLQKLQLHIYNLKSLSFFNSASASVWLAATNEHGNGLPTKNFYVTKPIKAALLCIQEALEGKKSWVTAYTEVKQLNLGPALTLTELSTKPTLIHSDLYNSTTLTSFPDITIEPDDDKKLSKGKKKMPLT